MFTLENKFLNVVWKTPVILCRRRCVAPLEYIRSWGPRSDVHEIQSKAKRYQPRPKLFTLRISWLHIDGLVLERRNSSALAIGIWVLDNVGINSSDEMAAILLANLFVIPILMDKQSGRHTNIFRVYCHNFYKWTLVWHATEKGEKIPNHCICLKDCNAFSRGGTHFRNQPFTETSIFLWK